MKKKTNTFNSFHGMIILVIAVAVMGIFFATSFEMVAVCIMTSLFCYCKLNIVFTFNKGHGVMQTNKFKFWGFTTKQLFVFSIVLAFIVYFLYKAFFDIVSPYSSSIQNFRYFALSMAISFCVSFLVWHLYWYEETYYFSEYDLLLLLKMKNYSKVDSELLLRNFKKDGFLRK